MYPRQNQNTDDKTKDVQKEIAAENEIGNNSFQTNNINNLLNSGNENAIKLIIASAEEEDKEDQKEPEEIKTKKKQPEPGPDISTNSNIINNNTDDDAIKINNSKHSKNKYGAKDPEKELFAGDFPAVQQFYKDPAQMRNNPAEDEDYDRFNESVHAVRPKRKGKKGSNRDLNRVNNTQEKIAGLNIVVNKLAARNKGNGFKRFMTRLAVAAGASIGKFINWIGAGLAWIVNPKYRKMLNRGLSNSRENPDIQQEARRHDIIPGWNGATFQEGQNSGEDILADFRRIPTVWSRLTAGEAEDKNGKPLAPKISVYIRQGKEAEDQSVNGTDPGHAGIGIEYSRYSKRTNRYERYNLRYGFFPGTQDTQPGSLTMTSGARIPGQLKNEQGGNYSVRRTYPATARQVNAILKASETYADKGYNSFNRNCTTFVKDMIQKEAGIPAGDKIFEMEAPGFSSLVNFGLFATKSSENTAKADMEKRFARLGSEKDLSYGGEGNMRVNKQEYRNYKESLERTSGGFIYNADLPNAAAENMRRLEGDEAGNIGSKYYIGTAEAKRRRNNGSSKSSSSENGGLKMPVETTENINKAITDEIRNLTTAILNVTRKNSIEELSATPGIDRNIIAILGRIKNYDKPLSRRINLKHIRKNRNELSSYVNDLNTLLFGFFKNDSRLHLPVMHMISLLEFGIEFLDKQYENMNLGLDVGGDLGNIRERINKKDLTVSYEKTDPNDPDKEPETVEVVITPNTYEAYLQVYKSPDEAINAYSRYIMLFHKNPRTKEEEKEYQKLKRKDMLADDYEDAHRYMLEKDSYNQQDIDYTFHLENMEKKVETRGTITGKTSSSIYKSLILEKIFGGANQRFENNFTKKDVSNSKMLKEWLDADMVQCVNRRQDEMRKVIKGIIKAQPTANALQCLNYLMGMINTAWIQKAFSKGFFAIKNPNSPLSEAEEPVTNAFKQMMEKSKLKRELKKLITPEINENHNRLID